MLLDLPFLRSETIPVGTRVVIRSPNPHSGKAGTVIGPHSVSGACWVTLDDAQGTIPVYNSDLCLLLDDNVPLPDC